jgi:ubiquinone/menaquinone biosynthesis C-methylase UbiE
MIDKPMNNLGFRFMTFYFRFRDYFTPPTKILKQVRIQAGSNILDFGAGSGSYSFPAAQLVGPTGTVYAADIHPLTIQEIKKKADIKGIKNLHTILTNCETRLPNASIDVVLLFYVLHDFKDPGSIIRELDRILRPNGILSVIDHKFDKDKVVSTITHTTNALILRDTETTNDRNKETINFFKARILNASHIGALSLVMHS